MLSILHWGFLFLHFDYEIVLTLSAFRGFKVFQRIFDVCLYSGSRFQWHMQSHNPSRNGHDRKIADINFLTGPLSFCCRARARFVLNHSRVIVLRTLKQIKSINFICIVQIQLSKFPKRAWACIGLVKDYRAVVSVNIQKLLLHSSVLCKTIPWYISRNGFTYYESLENELEIYSISCHQLNRCISIKIWISTKFQRRGWPNFKLLSFNTSNGGPAGQLQLHLKYP